MRNSTIVYSFLWFNSFNYTLNDFENASLSSDLPPQLAMKLKKKNAWFSEIVFFFKQSNAKCAVTYQRASIETESSEYELLFDFPFFLGALLCCCLSLLFAATICYAIDKTVEVVGIGECANWAKSNIKTVHVFSGLQVIIDCKPENGVFKTIVVGELDEKGVSLPSDIVKDGKLKVECYAQLHSASAAPIPAHEGLESSKIVFKSKTDEKHTFGLTGKLKFSPVMCTSAFLWLHLKSLPISKSPPLPKLKLPPSKSLHRPYLFSPKVFPPKIFPPLPPLAFPPKPFPPPVPIYKKPLPLPYPLYKPPPIPKVLPPPVQVYKPKPKPPVFKLPSVPIYKSKPKSPIFKPIPPLVPIHKPNPKPLIFKPPPPAPIYNLNPKPPIFKPLPPHVSVYKPEPKPLIFKPPLPPVPIYNPNLKPPNFKPLPLVPNYKPLPPIPNIPSIELKPCPPLPKLPPKYFRHPKFGKWPPLPPYSPTH